MLLKAWCLVWFWDFPAMWGSLELWLCLGASQCVRAAFTSPHHFITSSVPFCSLHHAAYVQPKLWGTAPGFFFQSSRQNKNNMWVKGGGIGQQTGPWMITSSSLVGWCDLFRVSSLSLIRLVRWWTPIECFVLTFPCFNDVPLHFYLWSQAVCIFWSVLDW